MMYIFEYGFLLGTKLLGGLDANVWAVQWANKRGGEGWEFIDFKVTETPVYGDQPNMDESAPVIDFMATAEGFAKRRVERVALYR